MITFSRGAAEDFRSRVRSMYPDHASFCQIDNFSTIDSMARSILKILEDIDHNTVDILSSKLRRRFREINEKEIEKIRKKMIIKHLIVDEAQDLNGVQYEIICSIERIFGATISLVGDPNQCIYQFRGSSGDHLVNFLGNEFHLSLNYRSTQQIIDFSNPLRPHQDGESRSGTGREGKLVQFVMRKKERCLQFILDYIQRYERDGKDLSGIAVICPTRGIGMLKDRGCSFYYNYLRTNGILVNQGYSESGNEFTGRRAGTKDGHVNLVSYSSVKGLEYDVVFVMDFNHNLMNTEPTEEDHQKYRYLLYVATSRAINRMFVFSFEEHVPNEWTLQVPSRHYRLRSKSQTVEEKVGKAGRKEREELEKTCRVTDLTHTTDDPDYMLNIKDCLGPEDSIVVKVVDIFRDYSRINRGNDEALLGDVSEKLFHWRYSLKARKQSESLYRLRVVEMIVEEACVRVPNQALCSKLIKLQIMGLTWKMIDRDPKSYFGKMEKEWNNVKDEFSRNKEFFEQLPVSNRFAKIIADERAHIRQLYERYHDPDSYQGDWKEFFSEFFYLVVLEYAYKNNHHAHILNNAKSKRHLIEPFYDLFKSICRYAVKQYKAGAIISTDDMHVSYPATGMIGVMDCVENPGPEETIIEIKCVSNVNYSHYLQLFLYNFCRNHDDQPEKIYHNQYKIINFLKGQVHHLEIKISPENVFKLLCFVNTRGNLKFNDILLFYDLETTGYKLPGDDTVQELVEISIKDYQTGMVVANQMFRPTGRVNPFAAEKTGLTEKVLSKVKMTLKRYAPQFRSIMDQFENPTFVAHNGYNFDDKIMRYYRLFPDDCMVSDTLEVFRSTRPQWKPAPRGKEKGRRRTGGYSLGEIYERTMGRSIKNAHRAMADVDALIEVIRENDLEDAVRKSAVGKSDVRTSVVRKSSVPPAKPPKSIKSSSMLADICEGKQKEPMKQSQTDPKPVKISVDDAPKKGMKVVSMHRNYEGLLEKPFSVRKPN